MSSNFMKYRLLLLLLIMTTALPTVAQKNKFKGVCDTLNIYLSTYRVPNYRPHFPMKLDSISLSADSTTLRLYANEAITGQAFTENSLRAFTQKVEQLLPDSLKMFAPRWLDKYGRDLGEYIPN
jgi:hypothetical protein